MGGWADPAVAGQQALQPALGQELLDGPPGGQLAVRPGPQVVGERLGQRLQLGDLNGDGKPDLVVANRKDDRVAVLVNETASGSQTLRFAPPRPPDATRSGAARWKPRS